MDWLVSLLLETHHQQEHQKHSDNKRERKTIHDYFDLNNHTVQYWYCTVHCTVPMSVVFIATVKLKTVGTCTSLV